MDNTTDPIPDFPVVHIPGSEPWVASYEATGPLEDRFPDQEAWDFCTMLQYNEHPDSVASGVAALICLEVGERDHGAWIWDVTFNDGTRWIVEGSCDYTGWDCQSWADWSPR